MTNSQKTSRAWRPFFVVGGVLYIAGGARHPAGAMVDMLADPVWFSAHATIFVSLIILTVGFALLRRAQDKNSRNERWLLFATVATALEAFEMGVHTMAYREAGAMAAGQSTPVLTTHLNLATALYPVFALALLGAIIMGQRQRFLGSPWIGWLGILGATAHGVVMWLVYVFEVGPAGILFPVAAISLSLWFILAGLWPVRQPGPYGASAS